MEKSGYERISWINNYWCKQCQVKSGKHLNSYKAYYLIDLKISLCLFVILLFTVSGNGICYMRCLMSKILFRRK